MDLDRISQTLIRARDKESAEGPERIIMHRKSHSNPPPSGRNRNIFFYDACFYTNLPGMIESFSDDGIPPITLKAFYTKGFFHTCSFVLPKADLPFLFKAVKSPRCCCKNGFPVSEEISDSVYFLQS
jgi:hypothetical protein